LRKVEILEATSTAVNAIFHMTCIITHKISYCPCRALCESQMLIVIVNYDVELDAHALN